MDIRWNVRSYLEDLICDELEILDSTLDAIRENRSEGEEIVTIRAGDGFAVSTCRTLLVAFSPYFRALLSNGLKETRAAEVVLKNVDPIGLRVLMNFLFHGVLPLDEDNVQTVFETAALLQVRQVEEVCVRFMESQISMSNVVGLMRLADLHGIQRLKQRALDFYRMNFESTPNFGDAEDFDTLNVKEAVEMVSGGYWFQPNEEFIVESLDRWEKSINQRGYVGGTVPGGLGNIQDCSVEAVTKDNGRLAAFDKGPSNILEHVDFRFRGLKPCLVTVGGLLPTGERVNSVSVVSLTSQNPEVRMLPWMPVERSALAVANSGDNLFVTGGTDGKTVTGTVMRFDPRTERWEKCAPMMSCRAYHALLPVGEMLFALGGWDEKFNSLCSTEVYDPVKDRWVWAPNMLVKRRGLAAAYHEGSVYTGGGHNAVLLPMNTVDCWDGQTWTSLPAMCSSRVEHAMMVIGDYLYAFGGSRTDACSCERLDLRRKLWWEPIASMPTPRPHGMVKAVIVDWGRWSGCVAVFGGSDRNTGSVVEFYNPVEDQWVDKVVYPENWCDADIAFLKVSLQNSVPSRSSVVF